VRGFKFALRVVGLKEGEEALVQILAIGTSVPVMAFGLKGKHWESPFLVKEGLTEFQVVFPACDALVTTGCASMVVRLTAEAVTEARIPKPGRIRRIIVPVKYAQDLYGKPTGVVLPKGAKIRRMDFKRMGSDG